MIYFPVYIDVISHNSLALTGSVNEQSSTTQNIDIVHLA